MWVERSQIQRSQKRQGLEMDWLCRGEGRKDVKAHAEVTNPGHWKDDGALDKEVWKRESWEGKRY